MCGYCSRIAATFADEISTSVKIQLGFGSPNNVSLINLFYIAFLYSHYLIYERKLSWILQITAAKQLHLLSFTRSNNFHRHDINNIGKNTTWRSITKYCELNLLFVAFLYRTLDLWKKAVLNLTNYSSQIRQQHICWTAFFCMTVTHDKFA